MSTTPPKPAGPCPIGTAALRPNPALKPLEFLVGEWRTTGAHPMVPGETLRGRASFSWHEGGAFLIMRSEVDHPLFPSGVAILGSDEGSGRLVMCYFDERGVSRLLEVEAGDRTITWRHDDPEFAQTVTIEADPGGNRLRSTGRMSERGGEWAEDLSQVFERVGAGITDV